MHAYVGSCRTKYSSLRRYKMTKTVRTWNSNWLVFVLVGTILFNIRWDGMITNKVDRCCLDWLLILVNVDVYICTTTVVNIYEGIIFEHCLRHGWVPSIIITIYFGARCRKPYSQYLKVYSLKGLSSWENTILQPDILLQLIGRLDVTTNITVNTKKTLHNVQVKTL